MTERLADRTNTGPNHRSAGDVALPGTEDLTPVDEPELADCWCGAVDGMRDECVCDMDDDACECPDCDPPDLDELAAFITVRPMVTPALRPGLL